MSEESTNQDVSNCISAPFDSVDGVAVGSWSLCYLSSQNQLTMRVKTSNTSEPLVTHIDQNELNDMLQFLHQVKMAMQQKR